MNVDTLKEFPIEVIRRIKWLNKNRELKYLYDFKFNKFKTSTFS